MANLRVGPREIRISPRINFDGPTPPFKPQEDDNWCWAACVEMVLNHPSFFDEEVLSNHRNLLEDTQCKIAKKGVKILTGQNLNCCASPPACSKLLDDGSITRLWREYNNVVSVDDPEENIGTDRLKQALEDGHLVEIGYHQNGDGHVVLVYGSTILSGNERFFFVHDPNGQGRRGGEPIRDSFIDQSGLGTWDRTWVIKKV